MQSKLTIDPEMIRAALAEDVGPGDATTLATVSAAATARALMVARQPLVVCGLTVAEAVFRQLDAKLQISLESHDGQRAGAGQVLLRVEGPARAILTAERTALNYAQRLSGVATLTARYVDAVAGTGAQILDTRKTTPGWRALEKYAVRCGGGSGYRIGLYDSIMIKDNHLAALHGDIAAAVRRSRAAYPTLRVEVEADTLAQAEQARDAGADIILLDNMTLEQLRAAVAAINGRAKTEASGGVNLQTVRAIAETGVDFISVGGLTHSAPAVDIGLDFPP